MIVGYLLANWQPLPDPEELGVRKPEAEAGEKQSGSMTSFLLQPRVLTAFAVECISVWTLASIEYIMPMLAKAALGLTKAQRGWTFMPIAVGVNVSNLMTHRLTAWGVRDVT